MSQQEMLPRYEMTTLQFEKMGEKWEEWHYRGEGEWNGRGGARQWHIMRRNKCGVVL